MKEKTALRQLEVKEMFVRFFDVDVSEETKKPQPLGVLDQADSIAIECKIIPVVFITNRTFLKLTKTEVQELAANIFKKVNSIHENYDELQIDCDWSGTTRENYFFFLKEMKKLLSGKRLSCTIRLHQVKYPIRSGVPEVDRGMLMFYNMGNVSDVDEVNSIYDPSNAKKYTSYIKSYALPLDVALPVFKWLVHYRNGKLEGLITKHQMPDISNSDFIRTENSATFKVVNDHLERDVFYAKGDVLRLEELTAVQLKDAALLLHSNLPVENRRVVLYDLDGLNLNNYEIETIEEVFSVFN